ncbi:MAG: hypothetical protein WBJ62_04245 [Coriobacteriia bacterium]
MGTGATRIRLIAGVVLALVLALGGQALADSLVPEASGADTNAAVGRAASSYLTGIRRFGAAVLWNRLDPIMHGYYEGVSLTNQRYMLSTIAMVVALDPEFTQSYYTGSWVLIQNDRLEDGVAMAERGVREVPTSGLLLTNLAQLQYLYAEDRDGALETAMAGLEPEVEWESLSDQYNGYAAFKDVFVAFGRDDLYQQTLAEMARLDAEIDANPDEAAHDHDHDNDGVPDH